MEESQLGDEQLAPPRIAEEREISLARTFGGRSFVREVFETLLLAAILFLILNTTTARFQVRGSSMEPSLYNGQYLVISRLTYWIHPPQRGDIIVFHPPNNPTDDYIKRVVGLPGERLVIGHGEIKVNGVPLEEPYIDDPPTYSGEWELEESEYFVLGDNRSNSSDSHSWGELQQEDIIGKAWLCYWPPEQWGLVDQYTFPERPSDAR